MIDAHGFILIFGSFGEGGWRLGDGKMKARAFISHGVELQENW
jgi:hypothetical protein